MPRVMSKTYSLSIIFLIFITYFSIQCFAKGFFLSLVSFLKWILALIITIILVPKLEPYISSYISNNYISGIGLGVAIYILSLFVLILIGRSLGKLFSYTGLGSVDKIFGFFFGFIRGYIISVCIFATIDIIYQSDKWPIDLGRSFTFEMVEKGSNYLIKEFPNQKEYEDAKQKVQEL